MNLAFDIGNVTAYVGVPFTTSVSLWVVLPRLTGWSKVSYVFLLAWSVPYVIGNVCDSNKIGPWWAQWHLLDVSYVQWSTTLGVTIYALVAKIGGRALNQQAIIVASGISLGTFVVLAYGWEIMQSWQAWQVFGSAIQWSDYVCYVISLLISLTPLLAFRRFRAAAYAQAQV